MTGAQDDFDIRPAIDAEMGQLGLMAAYSYAGAFGHGEHNIVRDAVRPEWTLCAFDGEVMATSFAAYPFTIRANGGSLRCAGISAVGTRPEYRRRGLLRKVMTQALEEQREQGQSVATLWASQAAIYQRYGFAAMGANRHYSIDTQDVRLIPGVGKERPVRRYSASEPLAALKQVYQGFVAERFGYLHRATSLWHGTVFSTNHEEDGTPKWTAVAYDDADVPLAYVVYSLESDKVSHASRGQQISIHDLAWIDAEGYQAIWRFLAMHDLVGRIVWSNAPTDDPLIHLLEEPRMLHMQDHEGSWLRIVDAEQALCGRGYQQDGEVVLQIEGDTIAPWNNRCVRFTVLDGQGHISSTNQNPQVVMPIRSLAAAFSGTVRPTALADAGLAQGEVEHLAVLDRMLSTRHAAHCPDHY